MSSVALGISGLDVTTSAGQAAALSAVNSALQQVNNQSAGVGAAEVSLNSTLSNQSTGYNSLAATKSRVSDTDYAQVSTSLAQANVQQQVSLQVLALYNSTQSNILSLLPK